MAALIEEFSRFAELFPEPILLVSTAGHLCSANATARATLFARSDIDSEHLIQTFVTDEPQKVADYLRTCARSAQPLPGALTFKTSHEPIAYRAMGSAFRSRDAQQRSLIVLRISPKNGTTSRFVALNRQIDQLKTEIARRLSAERQTHEQRELLQVTLASIGDAVIATDVEGRITFMNPVAEAHTGYEQRECLGRALTSVFVIRNENSGEPVEDPVQKVLRTGGVVGLANHTVLVRRNGEHLPIDDSAAPIRDANGRLFGVILVFHEVSASRKLQHELLRQAEALREADRRKDEFLAVLAHELRNPLAPLRNGLQIARVRMPPGDVLQGTIQMMDRQLVHLVRLVDDLMDINRVSRGMIELRLAPVAIADVLERSVEAARGEIDRRDQTLITHIAARNATVNGDAHRLVQIVCNLLTNSAKYSPDGRSIELNAFLDGTDVVVQVRDQGIGIPQDQLQRVFEMFSQVRTHQGRAEGGLGIGLSLVRTLVTMHGGSVVAHSDGPGTGSTFAVRLPVMQTQVINQMLPSTPAKCAGRSLRIVVADDNNDAGASLCLLLESRGHEVRRAATGREAIAQVDAFRPSLVFMDIGMPDIDGLQATRIIRQRQSARDLVIVALTGWGQAHDREQTKLAGVDRHVVKPISAEDLEEILEGVPPP